MSMFSIVVAAGAVAGISLGAAAGPVGSKSPTKARPVVSTSMDSPFTDNFDSYAAFSPISGQGGWQLWGPGAPDAYVDNTFSASSPNSLRLDGESDVVRLVDITSGKWRLSAKTYSPTGTTATGYFIALNTFPYLGTSSWSIEMSWNPNTGMVSEYGSPSTGTPIVHDQWIPIVAEVDLDTDKLNIWYNNVQIVTDRPWSTNILAGGAVRIQCWDFYAAGVGFGVLYYDDIVFEQVQTGCYANCDESTTAPILNVDDFTCFINQFAAASNLPHAQQVAHYANCDASTTAPALNVDDFTCFINQFAAGCP